MIAAEAVALRAWARAKGLCLRSPHRDTLFTAGWVEGGERLYHQGSKSIMEAHHGEGPSSRLGLKGLNTAFLVLQCHQETQLCCLTDVP